MGGLLWERAAWRHGRHGRHGRERKREHSTGYDRESAWYKACKQVMWLNKGRLSTVLWYSTVKFAAHQNNRVTREPQGRRERNAVHPITSSSAQHDDSKRLEHIKHTSTYSATTEYILVEYIRSSCLQPPPRPLLLLLAPRRHPLLLPKHPPIPASLRLSRWAINIHPQSTITRISSEYPTNSPSILSIHSLITPPLLVYIHVMPCLNLLSLSRSLLNTTGSHRLLERPSWCLPFFHQEVSRPYKIRLKLHRSLLLVYLSSSRFFLSLVHPHPRITPCCCPSSLQRAGRQTKREWSGGEDGRAKEWDGTKTFKQHTT